MSVGEALEGHLGMLGNGQGRPHQPLEIFNVCPLVRSGKADRVPRVARPAGPADPVDIILRLVRQIVIDHQLNPRDIDASGRDIRRDKYAVFPVPEALQGFPPLSLGPVGVNFCGAVLEIPDMPCDMRRAMLGP